MNDHQHTTKQGFPVQMGEVQKAQGTSDLVKGKSQHNNIALSSPPLGLPFEVFLYHLQSSFLVRSWLGTVGPRALTGDRQVKPMISARK